jgi:hypothetical protein
MREHVKKELSETIDKIENLFSDNYFEVCYDHYALNKAVVKTTYNEIGLYFEFAKMMLTSQKDANEIFDRGNDIIQFANNQYKIDFKINQCSEFGFSIGLTGYTSVTGYINDFYTHHLSTSKTGCYRAVVITKRKFNVSRYFSNVLGLQVKETLYGSGLMKLTICGIDIQLYGYDDKLTRKNYFIIETEKECEYDTFKAILDDIILGITYLTGTFLGKNIFIIAYNGKEFGNSELLSLQNFSEDLDNVNSVIPDLNFQRRMGFAEPEANPKVLQDLVNMLISNVVYRRTILLLCQAHSEPHYVRATLYSVALETVTNLVYKDIQEKNKPIQDKEIANALRAELQATLLGFKGQITEKAYEKYNRDIERLNSITNKQKLLLPFSHFGYNLLEKEIEAIDKRNAFLHGRIPETADNHFIDITVGRLLFCVNLLILKYIGFSGWVLCPIAMYQLNNKLNVEGELMRKI